MEYEWIDIEMVDLDQLYRESELARLAAEAEELAQRLLAAL